VLLQQGSDLVNVLCVGHGLNPFYVGFLSRCGEAYSHFRSQQPAHFLSEALTLMVTLVVSNL